MSGETVGELLRTTREARGLTLADVEAVTRIRAKHLAALEGGNFAALPSPAQARGFLRNYAQHLGLDAAEVLRRYDESQNRRSRFAPRRPAPVVAQPPRPARTRRTAVDAAPAVDPAPSIAPAAKPAAQTAPVPVVRKRRAPGSAQGRAPQVHSRRPRLLSADVLVAVIVTGVLAALLVWGGSQVATGVIATATPTVSLLLFGSTPDLAATATRPPEPTPTVLLPTPAAAYTGVNLTVRAEQRTWVAVKVDGADVFSGLMPPGEAREFVGQSVVEVITGNGKGVRVIWNGVDQGLLGDFGEVVIRLWTLEGVQTPTPTPTATAAPGS